MKSKKRKPTEVPPCPQFERTSKNKQSTFFYASWVSLVQEIFVATSVLNFGRTYSHFFIFRFELKPCHLDFFPFVRKFNKDLKRERKVKLKRESETKKAGHGMSMTEQVVVSLWWLISAHLKIHKKKSQHWGPLVKVGKWPSGPSGRNLSRFQ